MIAAIIAFMAFAVSSAINPATVDSYSEDCFVIEEVDSACETWKCNGFYADCGAILEEPGEIVTVTMQNGNEFQFFNDEGDWCKGDLVAVMFYDNGTSIVYDDEIITCKYAGWVSDDELETWVKS